MVMKRTLIFVLVILGLSIAVPAFAFAQELLPVSDMAAPLAMISFGLLGLAGGAAGYLMRRRGSR
jgi:uncharacterized membrane protein